MKFGSWTYDGNAIDLKPTQSKLDLNFYAPNPHWELFSSAVKRNEVHYPCCPEPYIDVTFDVTLKYKHEQNGANSKSNSVDL